MRESQTRFASWLGLGLILTLSAWPALGQSSPPRRSQSLNGPWKLTYGPLQDFGETRQNRPQPPSGWETIPATVPGNVELDMVAAGRLEDPSRGNRIYELLKLENYQWWYEREFDSPQLASGEKAELVFDGLDCLGTIWVNGRFAGRAANMLIPHRFDVTPLLRAGARNQVLVRIDPAVLAGREVSHDPAEYAGPGRWESLAIRKAPHMYGWDVMPRAVSAGLWRDVRLEVVPPTHWRNVYWTTQSIDRAGRRANLVLDWEFATNRADIDTLKLQIAVRRRGQVVFQRETAILNNRGRQDVRLRDVDFWWPRGFGEPVLYEATLTLRDGKGKLLDEHTTRLGVRTVELRHTDVTSPAAPGEFGFVVNGEKIFIKGTNWLPLDALHSRDQKHLDEAFTLLLGLNCNMLRAWGGNVYESDRFFELCDENGILVWQDFALACGLYPQDAAFLETMRVEAEAVVTRLRNHPSLALWAGNNENDDVPTWIGLNQLDPNRDRISREVLPGAVRRLDPYRAYLPSSPYHGPAFFAAGNNPKQMPEVHLWGPRGYFKDPYYTDVPAHFVSEIGYHGCPSRATLEQMFDPAFVEPWVDGRRWNDQWLTKSVRFHPLATDTAGRNDVMTRQVRLLFGEVPGKLDDFILASQATQAEAMKFFVEFWRQGKGPRQGIIWWNLRDGWPIISDAVVDYYNRKKLAYDYIQSVQRDVQAICAEAEAGRHPVVIVNDTLNPATGHVVVRRVGETAPLLSADFEVAANGKTSVGGIPQPGQPEMWQLEWQLKDGSVYKGHYLAARPPIRLDQYREWMKQLGIRQP